MFLVLGLLVFPSELGDVAVEGTLLAIDPRLRRPPGRGDGRDGVRRLHARRAGGARLGRAAGRGPRRPRDLPGDRGGPAAASSSSTSSSSPSCSRPCCRARPSSCWPDGLGVTTEDPALEPERGRCGRRAAPRWSRRRGPGTTPTATPPIRRAVAGTQGDQAAAHPARRAGSAGRARRRPLRVHRHGPGDRVGERPAGRGPAPARARRARAPSASGGAR